MLLKTVFFGLWVMTLTIFTSVDSKANLFVEFSEDAPKDFFIIKNASSCDLGNFELKIDLTKTTGKLIFDIVPGGFGENVAQPLEIQSGKKWISKLPILIDGQTSAIIPFDRLPAGKTVLLTVDVDDTRPSGPFGSQMISGSEIKDGVVSIWQNDEISIRSQFNELGKTEINFCS